ncbi:MAG: NifU N-terminal domain-containing protein [Anaerolineae bacterium]|nr:NifU N-terminal domain-containing protein [Anaerolineae bacterium]
MSEYVTVETFATDDSNVLELVTNMTLTAEGEENYASFDEGDEGTPIAQMLFNGVRGLRALTISEHTLRITRDPDITWEELVDEVRDALRDFFL